MSLVYSLITALGSIQKKYFGYFIFLIYFAKKNTMKSVTIAGVQGFYGDSPLAGAMIAQSGLANYLVHDALSELTLSILQKDKLKDPEMGYARDIEILTKMVWSVALKKGAKIVTNSGGLNPLSAALKIQSILKSLGLHEIKIACITGDDLMTKLTDIQSKGEPLLNMDNGKPFSENSFEVTHANVYIGAQDIKNALDEGAQMVLTGRVADPCLTLGILAHELHWKIEGDLTPEQWDLLANGILVGHLLECGGQASGGNSYAEWPMDYNISRLGYPIATVFENGAAHFFKPDFMGGKLSRNTLREQLVYEVHDPQNYITPDVICDFTHVKITELENGKVETTGAKGKPKPEKLKLCIGLMEGYLSDQFFFFSYPFAYTKALKFIQAVKEIWASLPLKIDKQRFDIIGVNGIHGNAAFQHSEDFLNQLNELGVRLAIQHSDPKVGKLAMQAVVCLGLNGPPGIVSVPGWGNDARAQLGLWSTLIPRDIVKTKIHWI